MLDWTKWLNTHDSYDTPPSLEPGYGCDKCPTQTGPVDYEVCVSSDAPVSFQFKVWDPTYQDSDDHNYVGEATGGGSKQCHSFSLGKTMKYVQVSGCECLWQCGNADSTDLTGCSYKLKIDALDGTKYTPYVFNGSEQKCQDDSSQDTTISLTSNDQKGNYGLVWGQKNDFRIGKSNDAINQESYECIGPD